MVGPIVFVQEKSCFFGRDRQPSAGFPVVLLKSGCAAGAYGMLSAAFTGGNLVAPPSSSTGAAATEVSENHLASKSAWKIVFTPFMAVLNDSVDPHVTQLTDLQTFSATRP